MDKFERTGDKNFPEPVWKENWEELRVDIISYRAGSCVTLRCFATGETTEVGGAEYGPIILEAYHLGCGLKTGGLKAPAQSIAHVRWT
jgi:hypothetical protein